MPMVSRPGGMARYLLIGSPFRLTVSSSEAPELAASETSLCISTGEGSIELPALITTSVGITPAWSAGLPFSISWTTITSWPAEPIGATVRAMMTMCRRSRFAATPANITAICLGQLAVLKYPTPVSLGCSATWTLAIIGIQARAQVVSAMVMTSPSTFFTRPVKRGWFLLKLNASSISCFSPAVCLVLFGLLMAMRAGCQTMALAATSGSGASPAQ